MIYLRHRVTISRNGQIIFAAEIDLDYRTIDRSPEVARGIMMDRLNKLGFKYERDDLVEVTPMQ